MNVLFVGDIVGECGREFLTKHLSRLKKEYLADFTIVNGENSAKGNGISPESAKDIFNAGADVISTGNHIWHKKEIYDYLENNPYIIRPANYPKQCVGRGYTLFDCGKYSICVINLLGAVFMDPIDSPFETAINILEEIKNETKYIIIDIHAEATSEKKALGAFLDGKVSAVLGTHTHTQTADEQILPFGTAYISDIGMTGAYQSILGIKTDIIVKKFVSRQPIHFEQAIGEAMLNAVIIDIDENSGKAKKIERINFIGL